MILALYLVGYAHGCVSVLFLSRTLFLMEHLIVVSFTILTEVWVL
jgi:hypothetical protein